MKRKLVGRYPCLFGLAVVNALRDVGLSMAFSTDSSVYPRAWAVTLPILMSVQVAAALEAYTRVIAQYPRLGVFASQLLRWCLALLLVASCISAVWDFDRFPQSILQAILFTYRYLAFVLAGSLVLPCLFLSRFPKPDKQPARNIKVHLWILVSYFCVYGFSFLSVNVLGEQAKTVTIINVIASFALCGVYAAWVFLLTRDGEISVQWPKLEPDMVAVIDAHGAAALERGKRLRRSGPE